MIIQFFLFSLFALVVPSVVADSSVSQLLRFSVEPIAEVAVRGYDPEGEEFIVNDPGTRYGEGYRYKEEIFMEAVQDYETGYHGEVFPEKKNMIVVELSEEAQ